MTHPQSDHHRSRFRLSSLQVVAILLVAGVCLISATFMLASDIGRIPQSLWDICTTPAEPPAPSADMHSGQ